MKEEPELGIVFFIGMRGLGTSLPPRGMADTSTYFRNMNQKEKMSLEEFGNEMMEVVATGLGERYRVKLSRIKKNNDTEMLGIMVTDTTKNISPTIYMESFYKNYLDGKELDDIEDEILKALRLGMPREDFNMDFFSDYEKVKDKICYKLISAERNKELMKEIPHVPYMDLLICFYYPINDERIGKGSILIRNSHAEFWGVDAEELMKVAARNTKELCPAECCSMEYIMLEMVGLRSWNEHEGELPEDKGIPMYVLTNRERYFGAAVILYEEYLEQIADRLDQDFYLIPSSIHEMILLPKVYEDDSEGLRGIICEVNQNGVEMQDVLSDNLYFYDRAKKEVCMVERKS